VWYENTRIQGTILRRRKKKTLLSHRKEKKGNEENKKDEPSRFFYTLTFNIVTNFVYHQIFEINKYAIL